MYEIQKFFLKEHNKKDIGDFVSNRFFYIHKTSGVQERQNKKVHSFKDINAGYSFIQFIFFILLRFFFLKILKFLNLIFAVSIIKFID